MSPRELLKPASSTTSHLDNCPVVLLQLASTKEAWQHRVAPLHLVARAAKEERLISVHTSTPHPLTTISATHPNPTPCFLRNLLACFAVVHFDNVLVVVVDARQVHLTVVCARLACLPSRQQLLQGGGEPRVAPGHLQVVAVHVGLHWRPICEGWQPPTGSLVIEDKITVELVAVEVLPLLPS